MYKKVIYASVVLDSNGYSELYVVFDQTPGYYNSAFTDDELATMDNGSYFTMDNGLANSCSVYNGRAGLTYAYVLNDQSADNQFIDVHTYCRDTDGRIGQSVKQITVGFAEQILKDFNLPFRVVRIMGKSSWTLIPAHLDELVGLTTVINGEEIRITGFDDPEITECWNTLMIHGTRQDGQNRYFRLNDMPGLYGGYIKRDQNFEEYKSLLVLK
ncbi:MAG: hypothetical protein NC489_08025 [Ruminococcus flavefaciens]|nr:hypothetical protein [Ruminococcus flavefaciens]